MHGRVQKPPTPYIEIKLNKVLGSFTFDRDCKLHWYKNEYTLNVSR